jgi:hypothetical protein
MKMNQKTIIRLSIAGVAVILFLLTVGSCVSFSNSEARLKNMFEQKMNGRTAFYDKMWKTISQKSQIALKNDSSFYRNVNAIMEGRKDAGDLFMKWVQESNPNANYDAVGNLYADLARTVEGQRDGFFMEEKMIQSVVLEHENLITTFPGTFWNMFYGRKSLVYKPITSDRTDEVIRTGKDNDVKVF